MTSSPELAEPLEDERGGASKLPWLVRTPKNVAWALVVFGGVGLLASFFLTVEYIHKLQAPTEALVCDLSLFVTCGPAMQSSAGAILGFPNIIIGLVAFAVTVAIGAGIFAGASYRRWFWVAFQGGLVGAAALVSYLQWYSAFELARLCLWCMIIWAATIPLVSTGTIFNMVHGHLGAGARRVGEKLAPFLVTIIIVWYLAVIAVVFAGLLPYFAV